MDDPGNLIYIAFLLISLVAGLIKKRNEKKNALPHQSEGRQSSAPDTGEIQKITEQRKRMESQAEQKLEQMKKEAQLAKTKSADRRKRHRNEEHIHGNESLSEVAIEENDLKQIDLRKAVIYSEILNPPYV